jgi:hypothetical protein
MVNKTRGLKRVDTIAGGYIVRDASYFQFQINDLRPRKPSSSSAKTASWVMFWVSAE